MKQIEVADLFDQIADLLELKGGENPFRVRAYRRAALNLRGLTSDLEELARKDSLREIPGVGEDLAEKIREFLSKGRLAYLQRLRKEIPAGVVTLLNVPGIGPKTAKLLYDRFQVKSISQLEKLVRAGKLRGLPGFGEKSEENILRGIQVVQAGRERMPLGVAVSLGEEIVRELKKVPGVRQISVAGSLRRRKETVRDIDVLVCSSDPASVMDRFVGLGLVGRVQAHGETKSSIRTQQGVQVDLRVVPEESFGAALVYFTGSKEHNIKIRGMALRKGLTVNEYGVFRIKGNRRVAGRSEEEVYRSLDLPWIPPELREDRGEVEAAREGKLPPPLRRAGLKGSFHNHSDWTDGSHPIEQVARAIREQGYEYMILSDHSRSLRVAGGLTEQELFKEMAEVRRLNARLKPFRILMGSEVDILPDGSLDYPDRVLAKLDVVIAAVHSAFKQPKETMTRRIIRALENPFVSILAHPTGRLLGEREAYAVDLEQVCRAAKRTGTALEMNCHTLRLDLNDLEARRARESGVKLVLSTDTHVLSQLEDIELGLSMARRAWVAPSDLLNTLGAKGLLAWVAKKRR